MVNERGSNEILSILLIGIIAFSIFAASVKADVDDGTYVLKNQGNDIITGGLNITPIAPFKNPKTESVISELSYIHKTASFPKLHFFATMRDIEVAGEKIQVVLVMDDGAQPLGRYDGVEIEARYKNLLQALVPVSQIENIAKDPNVQYIRLPLKPHPLVESQGVEVINATTVQGLGINGTGVKVAVIDTGFYGFNTSSEIWNVKENRSFSGDIMGSGEDHGTACAEIILDVAPNASLYLYNIQNSVQFGQAVDYAISQGIDIISCSLGWVNAGPYDGTGSVCDIASNASDSGILFINSAGNQAKRHYEGTFNNTDVDDWHEFSTGTDEVLSLGTIPTGNLITLYLSWDDWTTVDQDYDLYLLNGTLDTVASSTNLQNGSGGQTPTEYIPYTSTGGNYGVAIRNYSSRGDANFELYSFDNNFPEYNIESSSLLIPADTSGVMTVGASYFTNDNLEIFSSQGPTNDGRTKPDVTAPDGVNNSFYTTGFYGTSASAPHVAGAAALLLDKSSTLSNTELQYYLESTAKDLGVSGKDNSTGSGRIDVYAAYQTIPPQIYSVHNLNTSENFTTIQAAIYDSDTLDNQTITADSRTYYENVIVNKSLTIYSTSKNPPDTIVYALNSNDHVFNVNANSVNISGFTVINAIGSNKAGVYLNGTDHCNISGNNVTNNDLGIYLHSSSNYNTITNNTASSNTRYDFYSDPGCQGNSIEDLKTAGHPTTISFTFDNGIKIKGVDFPPSNPSGKLSLGKYVNATNVTAGSWLLLNISYNESYISGLNESNIRMLKYNGTWYEVFGSGVNETENYVYANITTFSIFTPLVTAQPNISSYAPTSSVNDVKDAARTFNITIDQIVNVSWQINGTEVQPNTSVTEASYINASAAVGTWNVSAITSNPNGTDMQIWIWNVTLDTAGPLISNLTPSNGSYINNSTPKIGVNYTDDSGINTTLVKILVDGINETSNATVTSTYISYVVNATDALLNGPHNATVNVTDSSSNQNFNLTTWNFTVDTNSPTLTVSSSEGTSTYASSTVINGTINGTGSLPTLKINGANVSITMTGAYNGTFSKSFGLSNGGNTFNLIVTDASNNTKTDSITVTKNVESGDSTTGGGGGGGGGGAPSTSEIKTDPQGTVLLEYKKESSDGKAKVILSEGITVLNSDIKPLESISITPMKVGGTVAAYNFGPDGATFDPKIEIKIKFDPKNVTGKDVVIKMFNDGKWIKLETTVDSTTNTATAKVKHFTVFALFTKAKASTGTEMGTPTKTQAQMQVPSSGKVPVILEEESSLSRSWIFAVVIVVIAVLGIVVYMKKRRVD